MRRNSKILAMFLVLIMLGGMFLSACGQKPAPPADTAPAAAPSEEPDSKAAVAETEGTEAIDTSQEVKLQQKPGNDECRRPCGNSILTGSQRTCEACDDCGGYRSYCPAVSIFTKVFR